MQSLSRRGLCAWLVTTGLVVCCMLGLMQTSRAEPGEVDPPFANAVQQRMEMIAQLKEISALLKEQNTLLRSGDLQVVLGEARKQPPPRPKR